jgi:predicted TIM-barrel fold metal-dependent hydrolase
MTVRTGPRARTSEIRARLDHPIVDVDAHQLEVIPVLLDILRDVGGAGMPDKFLAHFAWTRRTWAMTPEQRVDDRAPVPVWWPMPTENTIDRATTVLPRLLYERMDEIGLDFSVVYPGTGLLVVTLPGMPDDDLRRAAARTYNLYNAEMFAGLGDRLTPAAVIPMTTPDEAIEELDYAVGTLGLKAAVFQGDVLRPIPSVHREHPELSRYVFYQDCFGIDSPYDYDPVWQRCVDLRIAPTFHSGPIGWGCRASISRHQYNQLGGFAEGGEALCKSLFFGGVPARFPTLKFGFLEGGVAWAQALYCRMLEHWKKRNGQAILTLNPALLDQSYFGDLIDQYGHDKVRPLRDRLAADAMWSDHPDELDDWHAAGLSSPEDVYRQFVPNFYFGCEGDDRLNALAFDTKVNPMGARLNAMFGSDIGHFDVEDMAEIVEEVYELVEDGLVDERDFRDFTFENGVRLHGGMNPDFFNGTAVEEAAARVLASAEAAPAEPRV